jgi:type IV pilus assembly protein PilQ
MLTIEQIMTSARKGFAVGLFGAVMCAPLWAQTATDANHAGPKVMTPVSVPAATETPAPIEDDSPLMKEDGQQKPRPSQTPAKPAARGNREAQGDQGPRFGDPNFVGEVLNLNVVDADIRDVLNYVTEQYGINFVIDNSVKTTKITVNVSNVPWNLALESILRANGLGVDVNGPILRVAAREILAKEAADTTSASDRYFNAQPLYTDVIRLNYARPGSDLASAGGQVTVFRGGDVNNPGGGGGNSGGNAGTATSGSSTAGILPIIQRRLSKRGSIEFDSRSNSLIVTDVKENIAAVRQLVELLDRPEPQVEIEARIVVASRNFSRDLGAQINASVFNSTTGGSGAARTTFGGTGTSVISLTTGMLGTARINLALSAAEAKGQLKIVATPRVTALNNRPAQIESGQQIPVVTPQANTGGGNTAIFTTTYVSVPLRLAVTPQITDAGTVILKIVAENNSVNTLIVPTGGGGGGAPGIDTQRMSSEVIVPDGGTTVVGGVLADNESENQGRTPGVSSIPVLGNLFKQKSVRRATNEILFFITPRIYRPDYNGNPMTDVPKATGTKATTILQPVPLGNPVSNTGGPNGEPQVEKPAPEPKKP